MKATVDGQSYIIRWEHYNNEPDEDGIRECYCTVFKEGSDFALMFGVALCHPNDNYNKETARKISLTRAIYPLFNKEQRTQIWKSYFERK